MRIAASLALALLLAACERESAPSDTIRDAAKTIVGEAKGSKTKAASAEGPYAPRDECREVPGAESFRRALAKAVKERDPDALAALAAPDVKLDFGGGTGTAELRARLAQGQRSLWDELDALLELGCAVNRQGGIVMPWYSAQSIKDVDPMTGMIVTGENVPLYEGADPRSARLAELSWDAVELAEGLEPEADFQKVTTADGKTTGYVASDRLRSLIDYRLMASSRDGKWSFTNLVAGD